MRDRVQKMLHGVFVTECEGDGKEEAIKRSCLCEEALLRKHGDSGSNYRAQIRVLLFNLKDASNPDLKKNVVKGIISADDLVNKDVKDLASAALQEQREKELKEAIDAARYFQIALSSVFALSLFRCVGLLTGNVYVFLQV